MEVIDVKIDLVTRLPDGGCTLVLVEVGPWTDEEKNRNLQRLAQRISDCVTAVINGHVAQRYPATLGAPIALQVDSYDTPRLDIDILLARMQKSLNDSREIQEQLKSARFTPSILLLHRWSDFATQLARRQGLQHGRLWQHIKRWVGITRGAGA